VADGQASGTTTTKGSFWSCTIRKTTNSALSSTTADHSLGAQLQHGLQTVSSCAH
jgi:hypothetical protein